MLETTKRTSDSSGCAAKGFAFLSLGVQAKVLPWLHGGAKGVSLSNAC